MWFKNWTNLFTNQDYSSVLDKMRNINPIYIPRNHLIEEVIELANQGDFSLFHEFNKVLESPFSLQKNKEKFSLAPNENQIVFQTFCGT